MKNLLVVLLLSVVFMSCDKTQTWYEQGHVDPENECTFIVNDSIKIVGKVYDEVIGDEDILYYVHVNGEELNFHKVGTYHTIFISDVGLRFEKSSLERLIKHLQYEYEKTLINEPLKCFSYEKR